MSLTNTHYPSNAPHRSSKQTFTCSQTQSESTLFVSGLIFLIVIIDVLVLVGILDRLGVAFESVRALVVVIVVGVVSDGELRLVGGASPFVGTRVPFEVLLWRVGIGLTFLSFSFVTLVSLLLPFADSSFDDSAA